jgi:MFS family permease
VAVGRQAFFFFNLGGVIGIFLMGWMSIKWRLTNLIFYMLVSSAVFMVIFALAPENLILLLGLTLLIGILQQGGFTGLYATAAKVYPTAIRSTGIGWAIGLGRFGAVVGPAAAGYFIATGLDMSANYIIFAIPMAIGGLIAYRLHID